MMRTKHSLKNIYTSLFTQVVIVFLGFLSRKVFIDNLGANYLGVNGLLTNVLSIMALVESGIGISIVYNLYKPLADDDRPKIIALVQLYKKAYGVLALIIFCISLALFPLLGHLMKEGASISNLSIIYFLFVAKNIVSYLNAHKWSLINADQKGYVIARVSLIFQVTTIVGRILVLIFTQNYILYLILELFLYTLQSIINGKIVNKRYSYIKTKEKYKIDSSIKEKLVKNVKAMFLHNIGGYLVFGTDNILISSFISVATVGLYSNYTMITQQLSALVKPILGGVGASVGNLIATESPEKNYFIFKVSFLVNFWIYSLSIIFLYNLLEPFLSWWLGRQYLLDHFTFIFILINFYLDGMRTSIATFKNKAGLFVQDKYAPVIEGIINLISSLIFIKLFGLVGVFMGTTLSTIATVLWTQPFIVYKNLFKKSVIEYFVKYSYYAALTFLGCIVASYICNQFVSNISFISLIIRGLISLIVPNLIFIIIFFKSKEFGYIRELLRNILYGFLQKKVARNKVKVS